MKSSFLVGCGLILFGILLWIAICFGLTHAIIWVCKGFNLDLSDKFNYIWVGLLIVSYIFKK